jgi:hypothetical protein
MGLNPFFAEPPFRAKKMGHDPVLFRRVEGVHRLQDSVFHEHSAAVAGPLHGVSIDSRSPAPKRPST